MNARRLSLRARDIALKAQERATQALARLEKHEAVCEERHNAILATLTKVESAIDRLWWLMLIGAGTLICGMASLIVLLLFRQRV